MENAWGTLLYPDEMGLSLPPEREARLATLLRKNLLAEGDDLSVLLHQSCVANLCFERLFPLFEERSDKHTVRFAERKGGFMRGYGLLRRGVDRLLESLDRQVYVLGRHGSPLVSSERVYTLFDGEKPLHRFWSPNDQAAEYFGSLNMQLIGTSGEVSLLGRDGRDHRVTANLASDPHYDVGTRVGQMYKDVLFLQKS